MGTQGNYFHRAGLHRRRLPLGSRLRTSGCVELRAAALIEDHYRRQFNQSRDYNRLARPPRPCARRTSRTTRRATICVATQHLVLSKHRQQPQQR